MRFVCLLFLLFVKKNNGVLWKNGIVHYSLSNKDYDVHSQDEIISVFSSIQNEICVKFFNTPTSFNASDYDKILYIHNPDKQKNCPPSKFDYSGRVVYMVLGYKCINKRDIARNIVELLKASIEPPGATNTEIKPKSETGQSTTILSADERNYINLHYHQECGTLSHHPVPMPLPARRANDGNAGDVILSELNLKYYSNKLWPFGILMYGVDPKLHNTTEYETLHHAVTSLQLSSCIVAEEWTPPITMLTPKNILWFGSEGADAPQIGFVEGNQTINLFEMVNGAPGHLAHALNNLIRAIGVPMMSNRYDRDNYVTINWKNVDKGKEHFLEKAPFESWVQRMPYDFGSGTHAPANFLCSTCLLGEQTVTPVQDPLWQITLAMGHATDMNENDAKLINHLYNGECALRNK